MLCRTAPKPIGPPPTSPPRLTGDPPQSMTQLALLGPQRNHPTVNDALDALGVGPGPLVSITAGWQEREGELDELSSHLGRPVHDVALYRAVEALFAEDSELFTAHRQRMARLQDLQALYRVRLKFAFRSARAMLTADGRPEVLEPARAAALSALKRLDAEHLSALSSAHERYDEVIRPEHRPSVEGARAAVVQAIEHAAAVLVAGGHIGVLLSRLRLLNLGPALARRPVIAWSAGAMAMADHVVVFHDSPPQGAGAAEVFDFGLGLVHRRVLLPDAVNRLRLGDPIRVTKLAQRFAPAVCLTLDSGAGLVVQAGRVTRQWAVRALQPDGTVG